MQPALETAYRTGAGVPYAAYDAGGLDGAGDADRIAYLTGVADWLQATPELQQRSRTARRVLDIACGHGWSALALAAALPHATVDAIDADAASIAAAQMNVARAGLADRVHLHQAPAEFFATPQTFDPVSYTHLTLPTSDLV